MGFKAIFARVGLCLVGAFLLLTLGISSGVAFYFSSFAKKTHDVKEVVVEIPMGSSLRQVSNLLAEACVIDSPKVFYWYLRLGRLDGHKMQAGFYNFSGPIPHREVASRLLFGFDPSFKLVFKEGETVADLIIKLGNLGLSTKESFQEAVNSPEIIDLLKGSLPEGFKGQIEGYLFPDTYFFSKKDNAKSIIKKMHARFVSKLGPEILLRLKEQNISLHEALTLASIIEKETGDEQERPLIASVYQNRLRLGMRLQADPTVIYGIKDYDGKIRKIDLRTYHPYNTYKIQGLPPGPISSVGLASIRAVLWPATTDYLYFVAKNDGTHIFCKDLACHNKAVRLWQINYAKAAANNIP